MRPNGELPEDPGWTAMRLSQKIKVLHPLGLHLRIAAQLVRLVRTFHSNVYIQKGLERVDARSVLCLLQLAAVFGVELNFVLEGEDASQALAAIRKFLESPS